MSGTTNAEAEMLSDRWMVWYVDDQLEPVAVTAPNRSTARRIGQKARNEPVAAAVNETEGAESDLSGVEDHVLSTVDDPGRFIRETYR